MEQESRSRRRESTHRQIYEVGMQLFEEQGFTKVSVGAIVATAGVSVPTFYAHFPSKDRIVLQPPGPDDFLPLVRAHAGASSITAQVEAVIVAWLTGFEDEALTQLLRRWRLVAVTRSLQLRAAEIERAVAAEIIEALEHTRDDASPLAVQLTVLPLFAASTQALIRWAEAGGDRTLGEVTEEVLDTLRSLRTHPI